MSFSLYLNAASLLVAKNEIGYNEKVLITDLMAKNVSQPNHCIPLTLTDLNNDTYVTLHFILKGSILCHNDVKVYKKESVVFDFGSLQIEKNGKVIYENDEYIRIKRDDGKIEKIYKDGRLQ